MIRNRFFLAVVAAGLAVGFSSNNASAGEDPSLGVLTKTGAGNAGCVTVPESNQIAFQCDSCRVRYRLITAAQDLAGDPVPTDGGPMTDGGVWGPVADFTIQTDPYAARTRFGQTRACFYCEDAGASGGFVSRIEVSGRF
jgi:hypothetical protein